jgi:hypothetical protein
MQWKVENSKLMILQVDEFCKLMQWKIEKQQIDDMTS